MKTRRGFCQQGLAGVLAAGLAPAFVPASVLGATAPSKKITIGVIGCGRIAQSFNIPSCLASGGRDLCDFIGLCDVDPDRRAYYKKLLATKKFQGRDLVDPKRCVGDYHKLLDDPAIDGIMITTPDHWHAQLAIEACMHKKDVFLQKPMAMSIGEGRAIVDAAKKYGVILRTGTQQRATENFIRGVECVLDGRIGKVVRVEVGIPDDPKEYNLPTEEPIPKGFDWNLWQGRAPEAPYSQLRSHQRGKNGKVNFARGGWMTIQEYDMGMIANWGAHQIDTAQRGLGEEWGGPVTVEGTCVYPKGRKLWDVHGDCDITWTYANGAVMNLGSGRKYPCGIRWIGENGDWIYVSFGGAKQTKDDPKSASASELNGRALAANKRSLIEGPVAKPIPRPMEHNREWIQEMHTRGPLATPLEVAQRTSTTCILGYTAMKLGRKLTWDKKAERFVNDEEANKTLFREERKGFGVKQYLKELRG